MPISLLGFVQGEQQPAEPPSFLEYLYPKTVLDIIIMMS